MKSTFITTGGTVLNGALGAIFYILIARFLGPANFGLITLSLSTMTLIADIADLGTNTGLVRFVPSHLSTNKPESMRFLKLGLEIKMVVWLSVVLFGYLLAPIIASVFFQKPELEFPLRLSLVGVGGALLFTYATAALQSFQKFFIWSFINVTTNFLRVVVVLVLLTASQLSITSTLVTYIALPFLGFSLSFLFLPVKDILGASGETSLFKKFISFNKWAALVTLITAFSSRLDTFLTGRLLSSQELGLYSAANQLTLIVPQIVSALGVVAAPKFAQFTDLSKMLPFFKRMQLLVVIIALVGLVGVPISYYLIPLIYGSAYNSAITYFVILLLAQLIFLISMPVHTSIYYYFGKPELFVWTSLFHLLIVGVGGYFLILNLGTMGAAIAVFLGMSFNFLIPFIWFLNKIKGKNFR